MISGTEWILTGGILLPVGHWAYLHTQKGWISDQIQRIQSPIKGYEISLITPYGSERYLKSKYTLGNYRSSMFDVSATTTFYKYKMPQTISLFKIQKREYPKGVFYHPQTQQLASCSQQLVKDIRYLKIGPSLVIAGVCIGITAYSWLSYSINKYCEKPYFCN